MQVPSLGSNMGEFFPLPPGGELPIGESKGKLDKRASAMVVCALFFLRADDSRRGVAVTALVDSLIFLRLLG